MKKNTFITILLSYSCLTACSTVSSGSDQRYNMAQKIAESGQLVEKQIKATPFTLTSFIKKQNLALKTAIIYIEGDGYAFNTRGRVSSDPSPKNPVALKLAAIDTAPNVIYLARPCQYTALKTQQNACEKKYWSSHRFAPEVIKAYLNALEELENSEDLKEFHLVGYSGGGAVALLLSTQSDKIKSVRTIAGNLSPNYHSRYHDVPKLHGLDPTHYTMQLKDIPQSHYIGEKDQIVPKSIYEYYRIKFSDTHCIKEQFFPNIRHGSAGWETIWHNHHQNIPACK